MYKELTEDNLESYIKNEEKVMVQFSAGWCGNCRMMKPKFKKMASDYNDVQFIVVDAEKLPESRKMAEVTNLPTFAAFKNGKLINQVQTNKQENLESLIHEVTVN